MSCIFFSVLSNALTKANSRYDVGMVVNGVLGSLVSVTGQIECRSLFVANVYCITLCFYSSRVGLEKLLAMSNFLSVDCENIFQVQKLYSFPQKKVYIFAELSTQN